MISIRRYLQNDQKTDDTRLQLIQLLIQGIELHSVEGAPGALECLCASTRQVMAAVESQAPPAELLELAVNAVSALKQHNLDAVEHLQNPVAELRAKVDLLSSVLAVMASNSLVNIRRLREIKTRVLATLDIRDIHSIKARLARSMDDVLAEAERQRAEIDRAAEQVNRPGLEAVSCSAAEAPTNDAATGLPLRAQAEEVIARCCQDGAGAFVVVMVIDQAQRLNQSLGDRVGDLILQRFAGSIREQLPAVDLMFRWSGPAIVALIRCGGIREARAFVEPLLLRMLTVRITNPDLQVPVCARWVVLPLMASPRLLFHKMDSFAGIEHPLT